MIGLGDLDASKRKYQGFYAIQGYGLFSNIPCGKDPTHMLSTLEPQAL
ncbi:hypothetical protein BACI349Y_90203 [Bacillus sp. 349Y]|nr:hypothetical protein BACI349Y_90203 [Bacillus sp. 349Y]